MARAEPVSHIITLPWAVIVPDNAKYTIARTKQGPRIILTKRYREAKDKAQQIAMGACKGHVFWAPHLSVECILWAPDRRMRDAANILKLVCDALKGAAYADDSQIGMVSAYRAGIDRQTPRVQVTVSKTLRSSEAA